jgi:Arc/MetJ-type ribon-helix-helix transcriptional regulator
MARITIRLPDSLLTRLDALAAERGLDRSRVVRQSLEVTLAGRPGPPVAEPSEDELLELLAEKARAGNVAAIRSLLARIEDADPRERALAVLEKMAEERRQ